MYPPPCIHSPDGRSLCPSCQRDYDEDPSAYVEFGEHPQGIANSKALDEEIAAEAEAAANRPHVEADPNIPF